MATPAAGMALPLVGAHAVGSPEFYWAIIAESSILLFTVLLFLAPRRTARSDLPRFRLVAFGAALLASLVTLIGKLLEVWPGHPLFPSGHTAYAVTPPTRSPSPSFSWHSTGDGCAPWFRCSRCSSSPWSWPSTTCRSTSWAAPAWG